MARLEFSHLHSYSSPGDELTVPVDLKSGAISISIDASIDTGASHCLFQRSHGERLGLTIEAGERRVFRTGGGPIETFGHFVQIVAFEVAFESLVYFFADSAIAKNLLGRTGWLDRIRLGIVHYDRQLYLSRYDLEK